jgi:hypothetical protein
VLTFVFGEAQLTATARWCRLHAAGEEFYGLPRATI